MDTTLRDRARQLREERASRPGPPPDISVVRKLALLQCEWSEVASFLGVSESVIQDTPGALEQYRIGLEKGRRSLRRKMMQMALHGDRALLIWLSKNYLGMKDSGSMKLEGGDKPLAVDLGLDAGIVAEALAILAGAGAVKMAGDPVTQPV
tara:strand:+ start:3600 stop:4052 length:453 start_codon:yes stop_codon:yes gene_type:complete